MMKQFWIPISLWPSAKLMKPKPDIWSKNKVENQYYPLVIPCEVCPGVPRTVNGAPLSHTGKKLWT